MKVGHGSPYNESHTWYKASSVTFLTTVAIALLLFVDVGKDLCSVSSMSFFGRSIVVVILFTAIIYLINKVFIKIKDTKTPFLNRAAQKTIQENFLLAIQNGKVKVVKSMLKGGKIDVNFQNKNGESALINAASIRREDIVELLLNERDINVNIQNPIGQSPLMIAAIHGYKKVVELLIKGGADLMGKASHANNTPFVMASYEGFSEITHILAKKMTEDELELQREALRLLSVGHSFHIEGQIRLKTVKRHLFSGKIIQLGGASEYLWIKKMAKCTHILLQSQNGEFCQSQLIQLKNFLETSLTYFCVQKPEQKKVDRNLRAGKIFAIIQKKLPVMVSAGIKGHSASIFIHDSFIALANLGNGARKPLEVFSFDKKKLTVSLITEIISREERTVEEYNDLFHIKLPSVLKYTQTAFEKFIEKKCSCEFQKVHNCSWAMLEQVVRIFFLGKIVNIRLLSKEGLKNHIKTKTEQFDLWLLYNKIYHLERYGNIYSFRISKKVGNPRLFEIDNQLWQRASKKIETEISSLSVKKSSNLHKHLNEIFTFYLVEGQVKRLTCQSLT